MVADESKHGPTASFYVFKTFCLYFIYYTRLISFKEALLKVDLPIKCKICFVDQSPLPLLKIMYNNSVKLYLLVKKFDYILILAHFPPVASKWGWFHTHHGESWERQEDKYYEKIGCILAIFRVLIIPKEFPSMESNARPSIAENMGRYITLPFSLYVHFPLLFGSNLFKRRRPRSNKCTLHSTEVLLRENIIAPKW